MVDIKYAKGGISLILCIKGRKYRMNTNGGVCDVIGLPQPELDHYISYQIGTSSLSQDAYIKAIESMHQEGLLSVVATQKGVVLFINPSKLPDVKSIAFDHLYKRP